ncbi:alpha-(1,3)-fucosyltransferase C-like [Penaeus chinensis]|uniref:alpha-(1,3)-fucosyltransferase C-like n=1 Tax=Penaeus chinensis TaxID=139456 RepID=UPI001FB7545A|nr:alpha-(1,3)-fucosyltransferase C-like [Penaeus chinensis]
MARIYLSCGDSPIYKIFPFLQQVSTIQMFTDCIRPCIRSPKALSQDSAHSRPRRYGRCGRQRCDGRCWVDLLSRNYSFYMALENSWCDDYVTEKLYLPLANFLVPVVWGASNYSKILPPNSYIDARDYHPKELAELLIQLRADPVALGRYHVWRGFWSVRVGGTFCELCHRLHTDDEAQRHADIPAWRGRNGRCQVVPKNMFAPGVNAWRRFIKSNYSG